ncbi:MAG: elongation factor 4 [Candidatus Taylorbacteria bacterium CG10_big_fil_rev_8_21_14_0_10_41_48]|uniref:Elongation factor 4 n=1 Tax=Candidatus Taylorbacteria bacterium CG10_big_fil_rev_8_21_14_0_10_41_48 TaxID=1975024 RepID=A0A2M8LBB0_9BACT|nr:MAG: elongation factor 4 [Candidatus Taylorbacteria bacterium CG10_big_fil_rev_8_21_14_0_10_41_48]
MNDIQHIRNFSIIAHIDHGKSTLADRLLELTGTIEKRKMQEQVLDSMELERERGITIKMQPVRMKYVEGGTEYVLNLIDTPGHIDFSYEVSRALKAVEGSLLLVDATQGVQAQTLTTLNMARESGLVIIPVVSKIDSPLARIDEVKTEIAQLLDIDIDTILGVSGKTGEGVAELLSEVVRRVPAPHSEVPDKDFRSLVFDFQYSNHRGVTVYTRVLDGSVKKGDSLIFRIANETFIANEVGIFSPDEIPRESLSAGEIGYIVTGVKEPGIASVGDTITLAKSALAPLSGYMKPFPVVWASIYPESQDDLTMLRQALGRLSLSDSAFTYEEEASGTLGRGFRCGFLGMLHLEIITERLRREFGLTLVVTTPSITYEVTFKNGKKDIIYSPPLFPDEGNIASIDEPWVKLKVIVPNEYIGPLTQLVFEHEGVSDHMDTWGVGRTAVVVDMPLRELMRNFFDSVKSVTSGYASISYEPIGMRVADVSRLDILVGEEVVPAFTRIVARTKAYEEAEKVVEKLERILPKQMFVTKIQGRANGRILASRTLSALKKAVTAHLSGGDISRKKKLWNIQKEGKKRMLERGQGDINIPQDVFVKMMRMGE